MQRGVSAPIELRNRQEPSKLIDLEWLWFRSPHDQLAAIMMRTSDQRIEPWTAVELRPAAISIVQLGIAERMTLIKGPDVTTAVEASGQRIADGQGSPFPKRFRHGKPGTLCQGMGWGRIPVVDDLRRTGPHGGAAGGITDQTRRCEKIIAECRGVEFPSTCPPDRAGSNNRIPDPNCARKAG